MAMVNVNGNSLQADSLACFLRVDSFLIPSLHSSNELGEV